MSDGLDILRKVIEQHRAIEGQIELVADSISDQEAVVSLERAQPDWIIGRPEILSERQNKLKQIINSLDEGLKNHFAYEEKALPPLLGELLMRALMLDHQQIREQIDEAKSIVADTRLVGLSREELLTKESDMRQMVNNVCQLIKGHAAREEIILGIVGRELEEPGTK